MSAIRNLLMAGTVLSGLVGISSAQALGSRENSTQPQAAPVTAALLLAQNEPPKTEEQKKKEEEEKKKKEEQQRRQRGPQPPAAEKPAAPTPPAAKPAAPPPPPPAAAPSRPATPPPPPAAQPNTQRERGDTRNQDRDRGRPGPTPPASTTPSQTPAAAPNANPTPPSSAAPGTTPPSPADQRNRGRQGDQPAERRDRPSPPSSQQPGTPPAGRTAPSAPSSPAATPATPSSPQTQQQKPAEQPGTPPASRTAPNAPSSPAATPATPSSPRTQQQKPAEQPAATSPAKPAEQPAAGTPAKPAEQPAAKGTQAPAVVPNTQAAPITPAGVPKPTAEQAKPIAPAAAGAGLAPQSAEGKTILRVEQLRTERRETNEGGRTIIREPDRTIIREGDRTIIRHDEFQRFRYGARDVSVDRRGNETVTVVVRPNGDRIVSTYDTNGYLIRRVRVVNGREIVLIDNRPRGANIRIGNFFIQLPPPRVRIPRDRYIVEIDRANPTLVYETLLAPPVDTIERAYTLDEIRYSQPLRDRMPRIDLNTVNFDTGSWELTPDQVAKLSVIADGINRGIQKNPREIFLIEGHTDAVGSDVDNLSLSDRRAESVALALSEQFGVPPENLVTQGYGEQYLKVPTQGPEEANRRVTVRRITPLLAGR